MKTCVLKGCTAKDIAHSSDITFCYKCGSQLFDVLNCKCGCDLHPCDNYCPKCGKKVDK